MDKERFEEGEYIRTQDGIFGVFVRYSSRPHLSRYKSPFDCFVKLQGRKTLLQCHRQYIKKHSFNRLELIEVGDVIVEQVGNLTPKVIRINNIEMLDRFKNCENHIKSIMTKEKFEKSVYDF